jgi:ribonuclease P protein subunit POP4
MRNVKNILRHELIGLDCEIVESKNMSQVGTSGKIIDETLKTILIQTKNDRKRIQKSDTTFRLKIDRQKADVKGSFLLSRPEDRIKKKIKKW